jgi:hypothetical protein
MYPGYSDAFKDGREQGRKDCAAEIERLRTAIMWALGEAPDADGKWFGEAATTFFRGRPAPYGWRSHLRRIAGLPVYVYDKERRTLTHEQSPRKKPDLSAERATISDVLIPPAPDDRLDKGNR